MEMGYQHRFGSWEADELNGVEQDRRHDHRFRTIYRTALVRYGGDVGLWRVRNLSDSGIMLDTEVCLNRGDALEIALSEAVILQARVMWSSAGRCGAVFEAPINCPAILTELAAETRDASHRSPRLPIDARAIVSGEHGLAIVRLVNLSQHGARFLHDGRFHAGMPVKLQIVGGRERRGVVRWSDRGQAGLMLTEPFACRDLESIARLQEQCVPPDVPRVATREDTGSDMIIWPRETTPSDDGGPSPST